MAKFEGSIREFACSDKMKPRKPYARTLCGAAEVSAGHRRNASQIRHRLSQNVAVVVVSDAFGDGLS